MNGRKKSAMSQNRRIVLVVAATATVIIIVAIGMKWGDSAREKLQSKASFTMSPVSKKELARLKMAGMWLAADKKFKDAIRIFYQISLLNQAGKFPFERMAAMYRDVGDKKFEKLILDLLPDGAQSSEMYQLMGSVLFYANEYKKAKPYFDKYLEKNPADINAMYYKGALAQKIGENREAIQILSKVVERDPRHYYSYLELQKAYEAVGDKAMAEKMEIMALKYYFAGKNSNFVCALHL